jgi:hypothetical protein
MPVAREMTRAEALAELKDLADSSQILLEGTPDERWVSLDGWDPEAGVKVNGCVAGVIVRYWGTGRKVMGALPTGAQAPQGGGAPDNLDPRNALALVRLCEWLNDNWGVTELYHVGISGDAAGRRTDCHGQGRAVDFVGVKGRLDDGSELLLTVYDDWGLVGTPSTPGGQWPAGTAAVHFRLDDAGSNEIAREFFSDLYDFIAEEWQDRNDEAIDAGPPTSIGEGSFIMHPDHPTSAPGTPHGREMHQGHIHMQIGKTGTEA